MGNFVHSSGWYYCCAGWFLLLPPNSSIVIDIQNNPQMASLPSNYPFWHSFSFIDLSSNTTQHPMRAAPSGHKLVVPSISRLLSCPSLNQVVQRYSYTKTTAKCPLHPFPFAILHHPRSSAILISPFLVRFFLTCHRPRNPSLSGPRWSLLS